MIIGIPKEIKNNEYRVALPPSGVRELVKHGHMVLVEFSAGEGSGFSDAEYVQASAQMHHTDDVWQRANMVVKVKEPQPQEYAYLRPDLVLFTYLHLAASEPLTRAMLESGVIGLAYETVEGTDGHLPLLQPMSEVAGRMATQAVAHYLQKPEGGRGVLMGGIPGVRPARIVILGGGTVGTNAAQVALGMGAEVTLLDITTERLRYLDEVLHGRLVTLYSNEQNVAECLEAADAVIGAVLLPGARSPQLVTREMLSLMPRNSVIVDVAVDHRIGALRVVGLLVLAGHGFAGHPGRLEPGCVIVGVEIAIRGVPRIPRFRGPHPVADGQVTAEGQDVAGAD
ncbi:MAG: alanine dehydrogenase, partial [Anaerolineae bacterium]|nr:alanine dehydrogenase [Anaerolineae bacterium]